MTDEAAAESAEHLDDVQLDAVAFVRPSPLRRVPGLRGWVVEWWLRIRRW